MGKGQTSLEFLSNYGYMIIAVLVVVSALFYFGAFDISPSRGPKLSSLIRLDDAQIREGSVILRLSNPTNKAMQITNLKATLKDKGCTTADEPVITSGQSIDLELSCDSSLGRKGEKVELDIELIYTFVDSSTGNEYDSYGQIEGKISDITTPLPSPTTTLLIVPTTVPSPPTTVPSPPTTVPSPPCAGLLSACNTGGDCCSGFCYADDDFDYYSPLSGGTKLCRVSASLGTDCYDSNANAKPGQTNYFSTHRGDGSFDYNCNGRNDLGGDCFVITSCVVGGTCNDRAGYPYDGFYLYGNTVSCGDTDVPDMVCQPVYYDSHFGEERIGTYGTDTSGSFVSLCYGGPDIGTDGVSSVSLYKRVYPMRTPDHCDCR